MARLLQNEVSFRLMEYLNRFCYKNDEKCLFVSRNEWLIEPLARRFAIQAQQCSGVRLIEVDMLQAAQAGISPLSAVLKALRQAVENNKLDADSAGDAISEVNALCDALHTDRRNGMSGFPILLIRHIQFFSAMIEKGRIDGYSFLRDIHARVIFTGNMRMLQLESIFMPIGLASVLSPLTRTICMDETVPYLTNEYEAACRNALPALHDVPAGTYVYNGGISTLKELNCYFRADGFARCMIAFRDTAAAKAFANDFAIASQKKTLAPLICIDMVKAAARGQTLLEAVLEAMERYAEKSGIQPAAEANNVAKLNALCHRLTGRSEDYLAAQPIIVISDLQYCYQTHRHDHPEDYTFLCRLPARLVLSSNMLPQELEKLVLPQNAVSALPTMIDLITMAGEQLYSTQEIADLTANTLLK